MVCVCVCKREREREREKIVTQGLKFEAPFFFFLKSAHDNAHILHERESGGG